MKGPDNGRRETIRDENDTAAVQSHKIAPTIFNIEQ